MATERKRPGSGKRKARELHAARAAKVVDPVQTRRQKMIADGSLILADLSKQAPNNSYCPPTEYSDTEFTCVDCGKEEVWTVRQQQWWYEVAKGSINAGAIRCRDCRRIDRLVKKAAQWPLSKKPIAVVLETDDSQTRRMKQILTKLDPELVMVSRPTTRGWDRGIWHVLPGTRFISLGSEWLACDEWSSQTTGKFVSYLQHQRLRRPMLFHGSTTDLKRKVAESVRLAGWKVVEVDGSKADWIESDWRDAVSSLLKLKNAG